MPERTLALPLSGDEIVEKICFDVKQALLKNGFLNPNLAYDYFDGTFKFDITCHDLGRKAEVIETVKVVAGEVPEDENALLDQAEASFNIERQTPNEARVESGQGVPTLSKDMDGRDTIKKVRYSKKQIGKTA